MRLVARSALRVELRTWVRPRAELVWLDRDLPTDPLLQPAAVQHLDTHAAGCDAYDPGGDGLSGAITARGSQPGDALTYGEVRHV